MYDFKADKIIVRDTEYTCREWSQERNWSWPNEYMELVEIWAIIVDSKTLQELDHFHRFVKPKLNPKLSDYFINLTWINQNDVDENWKGFITVLQEFKKWSWWLDAYSYGRDEEILKINCELNQIEFSLKNGFFDIRDIFKSFWIPAEKYTSWTINQYFGILNDGVEHNALSDVRNIIKSLKKLYLK